MASFTSATYSYDNCDIPKNRPDFSVGFIGTTNVACENVMSKIASEGDQITYDLSIQDYINSKGYPLLYYPYLFEMEKAEKIHGEHSAAHYGNPFNVTMVLEIKDAAAYIQIPGLQADETVTAWLHIQTFRDKVISLIENNTEGYEDYIKTYQLPYNSDKTTGEKLRYYSVVKSIQPRPKDVFQLTTFGCDREWDRGNRMYEITNVEDEIFSEKYNVAMGHYVWKITAKRLRYGFETGLSQVDKPDNAYLGIMGEKGNHQVHDNEPLLKMFMDDSSKIKYNKVYEQSVTKESKHEFDMSNEVTNIYDSPLELTEEEKKKDEEQSSSFETNGWF